MNRRGAYALAAWITNMPVEKVASKCNDKAVVTCKQEGCERAATWNSDYCMAHPDR